MQVFLQNIVQNDQSLVRRSRARRVLRLRYGLWIHKDRRDPVWLSAHD